MNARDKYILVEMYRGLFCMLMIIAAMIINKDPEDQRDVLEKTFAEFDVFEKELKEWKREGADVKEKKH